MLLAADRLIASDDSISEISAALGYESERVFSAAFMRINGCSSRQFARERKCANFIVAETLPWGT
jgi:AraC-like DNA-binding protein